MPRKIELTGNHVPFKRELGKPVAKGNESKVFEFDPPDDFLLKCSHKTETPDEAFMGALYKKKTYEMLKFFLDDFVPDTHFAVGRKIGKHRSTIKEFTIQEKVAKCRLVDLPQNVRNSPILTKNINLFIRKLSVMKDIIARINKGFPADDRLEESITISGLQRLLRKIKDSDNFRNLAWNDLSKKIINSPNIFVNPETLKLSYLDFGKGKWSDTKQAIFDRVLKEASSNDEIMSLLKISQQSDI